MSAFLPLGFFTLTLIAVYLKVTENGSGFCWRSAVLSASLVWGLAVAAITEVLSIFNLLDYGWVLGLWALATSISAALCVILLRNRKVFHGLRIPRFGRLDTVLLLSVAAISVVTFIIALVAPPNTWDSMTYHMGRVVHWIQNRNVAFYPTSIIRQLYLAPWAEYAILQLRILSGSDSYSNLVQWFSMLGSLIGSSLIAKNLGVGTKGQIITTVVSATIPMGILQSSSTQNDYVVSFWLVCFIVYVTRSTSKESRNNTCSACAAASLGLAILTKATAYLFGIPFLVWFAFTNFRKSRLGAMRSLFVFALVSLVVNAGPYVRNFDLFRSPLGPSSETGLYANQVFTPSSLGSNVIRNLAMHLQTPIDSVNTATELGVQAVHDFLGIGVNDPRTTWMSSQFHVTRTGYHEDWTGNPVHLILLLASIFALLLARKPKPVVIYSVVLMGSFVLFSLYLRWQPWGSRLQLPLFVLGSPIVGASVALLPVPKAADAVALGLVALSFPWLFRNESRPVLRRDSIFTTGRIDNYFRNRPDLNEPYRGAVGFLMSQECSSVGLDLGVDDWEYPIWVLFEEGTRKLPRLEHIDVKNASAEKASLQYFADFNACAIISLRPDPDTLILRDDSTYVKQWSSSPVTVFMKQ